MHADTIAPFTYSGKRPQPFKRKLMEMQVLDSAEYRQFVRDAPTLRHIPAAAPSATSRANGDGLQGIGPPTDATCQQQ
eukprot:6777590-Pyramimonas_sp.AAC.1